MSNLNKNEYQHEINMLVDVFYGKILLDLKLSKFFKDVNLKELKKHQILFISSIIGSDNFYDEERLQLSHMHLNLTHDDYDLIVKYFKESMEYIELSATLTEILIKAIASKRSLIIQNNKI